MGFIVLCSLAICNLLSNVCFSVITPFLPLEFDKKGLDQSIYGYIFAIYAFALVIGSLIVGKLLSFFGRKFILISGIAFMGISTISFGILAYIDSEVLLIIVCLTIRSIQGFSSSMIQTSSYAIVAVLYKANSERYLGYLESSNGVGAIIGPVVGSAFYSLFGFQVTFFIIGGVFIVFTPMLLLLLPKSINIKDDQIESFAIPSKYSVIRSAASYNNRVENKVSFEAPPKDFNSDGQITNHSLTQNNEALIQIKNEPVKYLNVLFNPIFFIMSVAAFLSCFCFAYMQPVMSLRLDDFDLNIIWVGVFFAISPITYTISNLFITCFTSRINDKLLIFIGIFVNGLSQLIIGPSPYLPDSLALMCIGQALDGFTATFFVITCLPAMINKASERYPNQKNEVTDVSSGIFSCMLGLGQMIGPIYGSYVTDGFGFRSCSDSVGVIMIAYSLIFVVIWRIFTSNKNENIKENENKKSKSFEMLYNEKEEE